MLVNATVGHFMFSFKTVLVAIIILKFIQKIKKTQYSDSNGKFHYTVTPLVHKNARATYQ